MRQIIFERMESINARVDALRSEITILEAVAAELRHVIHEIDQRVTPQEVARQLFASNPESKIDAIKVLHNRFNLSLKDSKDVCDAVWEGRGNG